MANFEFRVRADALRELHASVECPASDLLDRSTLAVLHHGDAREEEIDPPRVVWDEDLALAVEVPRVRRVVVIGGGLRAFAAGVANGQA